jgi:hypothetical protein
LLREPKSGRDVEIVFIPQKVADRLREYVRSEKIGLNSRIFPICYEAARAVVRKAGNMVGEYQDKVKSKFSTFLRQHSPCTGPGRI